jgi:glucosamine--fructose-6-phosphate aminotransferase (isomerizing)
VDPALFAADLASKADHLNELAALLAVNPWTGVLDSVGYERGRRIIFVGMGSSHYAASVAAARLRAKGVICVAEIASSDLLPAPKPGDVVIAVSAGGGSVETKSAVEFYRGHSPIVLLTNKPESELAATVDAVVDVHAGAEVGGVACRSFAHTLALLLALEDYVVGLGRVVP